MVCLEQATTPRIGHCVALVICVFGCLGVVRGLRRESGDLGTINIGDAVEPIQLGCDK